MKDLVGTCTLDHGPWLNVFTCTATSTPTWTTSLCLLKGSGFELSTDQEVLKVVRKAMMGHCGIANCSRSNA